MEIELRLGVEGQEIGAAERHLARPCPEGDLAVGGMGKVFRLETGHIAARGADAGLQLGKGGLGVGKTLRLLPGQPGRAPGGKVAGQLDLFHQGQHVGEKPCGKDHLGLDLAGLAMRLGLGQDGGQGGEETVKDGDGLAVHGGSFKGDGSRWNLGGSLACKPEGVESGRSWLAGAKTALYARNDTDLWL